MPEIRYKESRILTRGIRRLPGQSPEEFRQNVRRLRRHFEQFNIDASEICQWLMSLRPGGKNGKDDTATFWQFILEPQKFITEEKEEFSDRYRRMVFDLAAGIDDEITLDGIPINFDLQKSINTISDAAHSQTAKNLFNRIRKLHKAHRQVLIKGAAEWIVARYWRGIQNWERQFEEWKKEKELWESKNRDLTEEIISRFNDAFEKMTIEKKPPRVCDWEKLKEGKDNCRYAGVRVKKKNHSQLCKRYNDFLEIQKSGKSEVKSFKEKFFIENAASYIKHRKSMPREKAFKIFNQQNPKARWFQKAWGQYLEALGTNEDTILSKYSGLPHCIKWDEDCLFNKHTENCEKYRKFLVDNPELQPFEPLYREWRRAYLNPPRKPSFKYPSSRDLPMPKIFGDGFHHIDFDNSTLHLRLDDMPDSDFMPFGFAPWPGDYNPQPDSGIVTSVHVSFNGTRARAGFRFEVPHKESRFSIRQEVIDELRSQKYPRRAQDEEFLNEARKILLDSFAADCKREMKILSVDLGTEGACIALFHGARLIKTIPLKVIKLDKLFERRPKPDKKKPEEEIKLERKKGLGSAHIARHTKEEWAYGAKKIAESRKSELADLGDYDMRRLSLHIKWMLRDWVRLNASQIIKTAEDNGIDLIVFESLRNFKLPGYDELDEDQKRRLAVFSPGRIKRKTIEKAVERGMRVMSVPDFKSSRICSKCGRLQEDENTWKKNKRGKHIFVCQYKNCGHKADPDENASIVLGKIFWDQIKPPPK